MLTILISLHSHSISIAAKKEAIETNPGDSTSCQLQKLCRCFFHYPSQLGWIILVISSNQPTLVHAKFLVSLFKKGIELAGEMPETGEILMILLENHQPIESIWNFLVNIFLFHLSISIPSFSLDMAGQT